MTDELAESLRQRLAAFRERQPAVFGTNGHRFRLNEPSAEEDVAAFEAEHGIALPADYRWFITRVGNGGAGPYYGVFPLGEVEDGESLKAWQDLDLAGSLARPFPHRESWNDLTGRPDENADDEAYEAFDRRYYAASLVEGAFPLCEIGCALRVWLVVSGPEAGHLWYDWRPDGRGLVPVSTATSPRVTFLEWYRDWLAEVERASAEIPDSTSRVISVGPGAAAADGETEAGLFARLRRWLGGSAR